MLRNTAVDIGFPQKNFGSLLLASRHLNTAEIVFLTHPNMPIHYRLLVLVHSSELPFEYCSP